MGLYLTVYVLSIVDIGLTVVGITTGEILEGNPLLQMMNKYPVLIGVNLALIIGMILKWVYFQKQAWVRYPLVIITLVKVGILILHASWIVKSIRG